MAFVDPGRKVTHKKRGAKPPRGPNLRQGIAPALAEPPVQPDPFDFSADPILQQAHALSMRGRAEAEADALSLQRQLAIEYGDETLGGEAAKNNPFSFLSRMKKARQDEPRQLLENLDPSLVQSTERNRQEAELQRSLLDRETQGANQFRSGISGIQSQLRSALLGFDEQDAQAATEAASRLRDQLGDTPMRPAQNLATMIAGANPAALRRNVRRAARRPRGRPY